MWNERELRDRKCTRENKMREKVDEKERRGESEWEKMWD